MPSLFVTEILILFLLAQLRVDLPGGLFLSVYPTKILQEFLSAAMRATCSAFVILIDVIKRIIFGEEYKS
jgi:hypothetical protein